MIGRVFTDWGKVPDLRRAHGMCSPNLDQLRAALTRRWRMKPLGCYGARNIAGTAVPSTHSWGAAIDLGYDPDQRDVVEHDVIAYLIAWSGEWNLSALHDYRGCRIWRAGRTADESEACTLWWKAQKRSGHGMGQSWANWLHLETTEAGWSDDRWEAERGIR